MKYKAEFPVLYTETELENDLRGAKNLGKVHLGELVMFFSRFAGGSFMPYSQAEHAYLRQEEVTAKMCCGRANFDQFYLMLKGSDGVLRKHQVKDMAAGKYALDYIAAKNPNCVIGYRKPATV